MSVGDGEPHGLAVETANVDGIEILSVRGELEFSSSAPLSSALAALSGGPRRVVVDLSELEFVDSSGVKMLVAAARAVEDAGGVFVLAAPAGAVRRVFEILHVDEVVPVAADRAAALVQAGGPGAADEAVAGDG